MSVLEGGLKLTALADFFFAPPLPTPHPHHQQAIDTISTQSLSQIFAVGRLPYK